MKKQKYLKNIILIVLLVLNIIMIIQPRVLSRYNPDEYTPDISDADVLKQQFGGITAMLLQIGSAAAVILLMVVGIKFMTGSIEEKAEYKKRMTPYVIGAILVFATEQVIGIIRTVGGEVTGSADVRGIANKIEGYVIIIGRAVGIIILICLGIKYVMGSIDEKASYKSSMMPYVIGVIVCFAAETIVESIKTIIGGAGGSIDSIGVYIGGIVKTIGIGVSSIILIVIGIKYMVGSTEEKAQYKASLMPYLLGSIIIVASTTIFEMIQSRSSYIVDGSENVIAIEYIKHQLCILGSITSVVTLVVIGIRYMIGSAEDKSQYKKSLMPYVIGAVIVFAASTIVDMVGDFAIEVVTGDIEGMGQRIVRIVSTIGSIVSVAMLVVIGIKYMVGGTEDKAQYKKSLMPYVIGATIVFAASQLAGIIYNLASRF